MTALFRRDRRPLVRSSWELPLLTLTPIQSVTRFCQNRASSSFTSFRSMAEFWNALLRSVKIGYIVYIYLHVCFSLVMDEEFFRTLSIMLCIRSIFGPDSQILNVHHVFKCILVRRILE